MTCSQTSSATQALSPCLNTGQAYQCFRDEPKSSLFPRLSYPTLASPTLSQYLPHFYFQQSSHLAILGTSSFRGPTQLLPARLRPLGKQSQAVEDACTTTFTTISLNSASWGPGRKRRSKGERRHYGSEPPFPLLRDASKCVSSSKYSQEEAILPQCHPSEHFPYFGFDER